MSATRPAQPYDVHGDVEYRVFHRVNRSDGPVWCLSVLTDQLDHALDCYGAGGPDWQIQQCQWVPVPGVEW